MLLLDDTIAALASPAGGAARGIVRISGPSALQCAARCAPAANLATLGPTQAPISLPAVLDAAGGLPCELYIWPGRRSYTREPLVEIHTLGSPPLLDLVLSAVCRAGARPARPGEFTLRAFLAGRIDLTQAEAVLGVIDAADARMLDRALCQLAGGLATPLGALRGDLLDLLADLEAGLDFADERLDFVSPAELIARLDSAGQALARIAGQLAGRDRQGEMARVVLVGRPNVGKSSLFNALAGRSAALVADSAGTTRDYLTAEVDCEGVTVLLVDTAGIDSEAEVGGISKAAQGMTDRQIGDAQLLLLCLDRGRSPTEREQTLLASDRTLLVLTKCDLSPEPPTVQESFPAHRTALHTSARTGAGLSELRRAVCHRLQEAAAETAAVPATAVRCRDSIAKAQSALERAYDLASRQGDEVLIAAELRASLEELGAVAGQVFTDDLLDRIFTRFCIGK